MNSYKILVVEDDKEISKAISIYLNNQGYKVLVAMNGIEALDILKNEEVHLGIFDIMMPKMDGIELTMIVREKFEFPIIMLSAKSEEIDKINGLNLGADDYVTKPFSPMELIARVNSQLRRYKKYLSLAVEEDSNNIVIDELEMDLDSNLVKVNGEEVRLTRMEFNILKLLMSKPGRVFPPDEIYERVWNETAINTDTIMVHVRNIREKIEEDPKRPKYLKVVWGVGYKIEKY